MEALLNGQVLSLNAFVLSCFLFCQLALALGFIILISRYLSSLLSLPANVLILELS